MCHSNCSSCGVVGHQGCTPTMIAKVLLIIGGINWGLIGIGMLMGSDWNVVKLLLGSFGVVEAIVYILVGIAAVMKIFGCKCKKCMAGCDHNTSNTSDMGKEM